MTTEQPPSRLQIAQSLAAHFGHRDFDQYIGLLSEDVTYRVDGNHALSGTFHGPEEIGAHVRDVVDRTGSTYDAVKWENLVGGRASRGISRPDQCSGSRGNSDSTTRLPFEVRSSGQDLRGHGPLRRRHWRRRAVPRPLVVQRHSPTRRRARGRNAGPKEER